MIKIGASDGVIFEAAEVLAQADKLLLTGPFWTPSAEQVLELETRLPDGLIQRLTEKYAECVHYDLAIYIRQYAGIEVAGEKCIWINFFCPLFDWLVDYVGHIYIWRGGCCFQLIYHLNTQTFSNFTIPEE